MKYSMTFGLSALATTVLASSGTFTALTFNVAGLPAIFNGNEVAGDKATNAGILGKYFAEYGYDLIQLQEDFNYHAQIYATDNHPYRSATSGPAAIGSGMNTLSNFQWTDFERVKWATCSNASGADCLTPKGFTFMRWMPADGVYIDVYNLHADAGTEPGDLIARSANLQQVADHIDTWSIGNPVLVLGDTNSRYTRADDTGLRVLHTQSGLTDAWVEQTQSGTYPVAGAEAIVCDNPSTTLACETVDKILYRGSSALSLAATSFAYAGASFLNTDPAHLGGPLSDHNPELATFAWSTTAAALRRSALAGGPHGVWFNDMPSLPAAPVAAVITFRGGARLDAVALQLADGTMLGHGGDGGEAVTLTLQAGEHWTGARLCWGKQGGNTRNFYIGATTSAGRMLEAGTQTGDCENFEAGEGWAIVGFLGRAGDGVDQLGFVYAPRK